MTRNYLIRKDKVNSKIHVATAWLTNNCNTHISNISRSKGNRAMKFSQLMEYNMRNIFLEKSYTKCGGDTIPSPFSQKSKLSISLDQYSKIYTACFYCMPG